MPMHTAMSAARIASALRSAKIAAILNTSMDFAMNAPANASF